MNENQKSMNRRTLLFLPAKVAEGLVSVWTLSYLSGLFTTAVNSRFVVATTAMNLAYILLFAWLANSASRYCGDYLGKGRTGETKKAFYSTLMMPFFLIFALAIPAVFLFCRFLLPEQTGFYLLVLAMVFAYGAFQIFSIILVQTDRALAYALLSVADAGAKLLLCLILSRPGLLAAATPASAMAAYVIADLLAALGAAAVCGFFGNFALRSFDKRLMGTFLSYGYPLIGVSFSVAMLNMAYRFLLETYAPAGTLAVYNNNASLSNTVFTMLSVSMMRAAYPSILTSFRSEGREAAQRSVTAGLRNFLLLAVPAAFGLTAVAKDLSGLILRRPDYAAGVPAVGMVAFAMLFSGMTEYANKGWELGSNTRPILVNSLVCAVFNIGLNLLLIPRFGFLSAALVLLLSYMLYFCLSYFRTRSVLRLKLPLKNLLRITGAGLACGLGAFGVSLLPLSPVLRLGGEVAAGAVLYAGVLILSGEISEELSGIRKFLSKRRAR